MKRLLYIFPLLFLYIAFTSCDNELDINADYKEIAVVYGLLDPRQDTQWVRIQRGYLGTAPASQSFNEPDSLYYKNLTATLIEYNEELVEQRQTILIEDASRKLNEGIFTTEGFKLYRTPAGYTVTPGFTYKISVEREGIGAIVESDLDATAPVIRASLDDSKFLLKVTTPPQTGILANPPIFLRNFEWSTSTAYSAEAFYTFEYNEIDINTKQSTKKSFRVNFPKTVRNSYTYGFPKLYDAIAANVQKDDNVVRFFRKMTFKVTVINRELDTYLSLNLPTTGILQSRPDFTNITNGIGVFSSRTTAQHDSIRFNENDYASLVKTDKLCELNFAIIKATGDTVICNFIGDGSNSETVIKL